MPGKRMKNIVKIVVSVFFFCAFTAACQNNTGEDNPLATEKTSADILPVSKEKHFAVLPDNIAWLTNKTDPVFASKTAQKGGVFHSAILSFPMTFRVVGPDSNGSFRSAVLDNQLSLINIHPNTDRVIPELATHWAFDDDKKTMYFKLDRNARWSDGRPLTAWDYAYSLEFYRSEHIIAPWYNDYYTREIEKILVFDKYTIGVKSTKAVPDLHLKLGISPMPEHFFTPLNKTFVHKFNWAIVPNTGPYQISEFKKGKFIKFSRKKEWWAKDKRYFKNRFNVDRVVFDVIRDENIQWEYFKKGRLDTFNLRAPKYWYGKSNIPLFQNGYVNKIWFFNNQEQPSYGMWLNQDREIFNDRNVRYSFAHAMNVERVIKKVLRGDFYRLPQAFFGYGEYTDYTIEARDYNIAKVKSYMTDAGWIRGNDGVWQKANNRFSVKVTYSKEDHTPRLVVLKEEALKAGVELLLERLDSTTMFKKFLEKKHDVAWMGWSTSMRPSFWQGWHSDNAHKPQTNNITNTDDPLLDELIDAYRVSLNETERMALSVKIQRLIHDIGAFVPTFMIPYTRSGYWRWVELPEFYGTRRSDDLFDPFSAASGGLFWINTATKDATIKARKENQHFLPMVVVDEQFKAE